MLYDKTSLIRQLVPTKYHFDAYNQINYPNSRDRPFFSDSIIQFDDKQYLNILLKSQNKISLAFSSVCSRGEITFQPYCMSLEEFVSKLQEAIKTGRDFIPLEISVTRNYSVNCKSCTDAHTSCKKLLQKNSGKVYAAVSFNFSEMKEALASYFEITNMQTSKGEKNNMKKSKFLGANFEFGFSKDPNIASTLMGLAVKNPQNGNWYVFDPVTQNRKNISDIKMGNFPVMLLPSREYVVGRLYKEYGQYCFVQALNSDGTVTFVSAVDGIIRQQIPEKGLIPGLDFHTEVIAFDAQNLINGNSKENISGNLLAAMLMMNWSKDDGAEFSLDSIDNDSFNGLGKYLLLFNNKNNGSDANSTLLTWMALGSGDSDDNDMMQMMVLSQLLSGGNNPFSGIFPSQTAPVENSAGNKLVCEKCGATYPEGTNFCPKCGGKTKPMTHTCRVCGATLMEGAAFCHNCGTKVAPGVCPRCGHPKTDGALFCPKCGTSLTETAPVTHVEALHEVKDVPNSEAPTPEA